MSFQLHVTLDFLHLENALFAAEQSIDVGISSLEVGTCLLKNVGLSSVKVLRERFSDIPIIVDMKLLYQNIKQQIEAVAKVGGTHVTLSAMAPMAVVDECVAIAKENKIDIIIDSRGIFRSDVTKPSRGEMFYFSLEKEDSFCLLQQFLTLSSFPIVLSGNLSDDNIAKAITMGISYFNLTFNDHQKNIQKNIKKIQSLLEKNENTSPTDALAVNKKNLIKTLEQLSPLNFSEVVPYPCLLENLYPILKQTRVVGKIATLKVWAGAEQAVIDFLQELEPETAPETVVVIDAGGGHTAAVWGQLATEIALRKKLTAAIIWGSVTEVDKIRERGFPCYTATITSKIDRQEARCIKNTILQIGKVLIKPGDFIVADDSGVVSIAADEVFTFANRALHWSSQKIKIVRKIEDAEEAQLPSLILEYFQTRDKWSIDL